MNLIIWLATGAVLGWLASILLHRRQSTLVLNLVVGIVGAFLAGYLLPSMLKLSESEATATFSLPAFGFAVAGAVVLLAVVNFFQRENNVGKQTIEGKWDQVRDKIQVRWDKITDEDIAKIDGNYSRFVAVLQERYHYSKKESEEQIQRYLKSILKDRRAAFLGDHNQTT